MTFLQPRLPAKHRQQTADLRLIFNFVGSHKAKHSTNGEVFMACYSRYVFFSLP